MQRQRCWPPSLHEDGFACAHAATAEAALEWLCDIAWRKRAEKTLRRIEWILAERTGAGKSAGPAKTYRRTTLSFRPPVRQI